MSKCESNIDELIVPGLVEMPGTVSSRLSDFRGWHGDASADVSELETAASDLEVCGLTVTAIDFANPCARYSEVSIELGGYVVHGRLIEPLGHARASEFVPLCLMFHDIDRPVRGWHHMTRFAAMGYAVLALDDDVAGADDLQRGIASPAFVERVRWGCALAKVARNLDGMDPDRIFAWGEGLGGGVALAVSALDEQGLACTAVANPIPGGLEALSSRVRGSVLMGTSLMDAVSDPKGQFAVFNGLECDRRHIIYAKYAHERINAFENEVVDFFNQTFYPCSLA